MASLGAEFGFPTVYWSTWNVDATFLPCTVLPAESEGRLFAVIVHCFFGDNMVLADIEGRGPTVPSGRVEPGETPEQAMIREVHEETGAVLHEARRKLVGATLTRPRTEPGATYYSPVYIAEVATFEPIPEGSESNGYLLIAPENIADTYYAWDPLLEAEFEYVWEQRPLLFPAGVSLTEFTGS